MSPNLKNYICLVTGASRGIGRGIAIELGTCGATVYLTGRTLKPSSNLPSDEIGRNLQETADEITSKGGLGIPVAVDHSDDSQVTNLFARIRREQKGRLDLVVNNAFAAVEYLCTHRNKPYWELEENESPSTVWDVVNRVGLRNNYICATLATRMMLEYYDEESIGETNKTSGGGLIINISSFGGCRYLFNVAYGVGKCAVDRMSADMAIELKQKDKKVSIISLWPGIVKTEKMMKFSSINPNPVFDFENKGESPELTGRVISALVAEPLADKLNRSGHIFLVADTALQLGIRDTNGNWPRSMRSINYLLEYAGWNRLANIIPNCFRIPYMMLTLSGSKF